MSTIRNIIDKYVVGYKNISLKNFILEVNDKVYPNYNFYFLDQFLEMTEKYNFSIEKCNINYEKLIEYGVAFSDRNDVIKKKLDNCKLVEGVDYIVKQTKKDLTGNGKENTNGKNSYLLSYYAFKLCLLSSNKKKENQEVDPLIFKKYYLLLEECVNYYNMYQSELKDKLLREQNKLISSKDEKIDKMSVEINEMRGEIHELLNYGKDASEKLTLTSEKLTEIKTELTGTKDELIETKIELKNTNKKLDKSIDIITSISDDINLKTPCMQYFTIFRDGVNDLKLYFNFGSLVYIEKIKKEKLSFGHNMVIDQTYTPGGLSLRKRCYMVFDEINEEIKEDMLEEMRGENKSTGDINKALKIYKSNPAIIKNLTSFEINTRYSDNINIRRILNIILETHQERFNRYEELNRVVEE